MAKVNEKPVKIFSFGALSPAPEDAKAVEDQFKAARWYRNRLISLDLAYRKERDRIYLKHPAYAAANEAKIAAEQAIEAEIAAMRKLNQIARSKSANEEVCKPHISALKNTLRPRLEAAERAAWEALKEAKGIPEIQAECEELSRHTTVAYRLARGEAIEGVTEATRYRSTERYRLRMLAVESATEKKIREILEADPEYGSAQNHLKALQQIKGKAAKDPAHKRALTRAKTALGKTARSNVLHKPANAAQVAKLKKALERVCAEIDAEEAKIPVPVDPKNPNRPDPRKSDRPRAPLSWGTAAICMEAHKAMQKSPTPPEYKKWNGGGRIGLQFGAGGLPLAEVFDGTNSFLRITKPPETAYLPRTTPKPEPAAVSPEIQALLNKRNELRKARAKRVDIEVVQEQIRALRAASDPTYAAYREAVLRLRKAKGTPEYETAKAHLRETRRACSAATPDGFNSPKQDRRTEVQLCIGKGRGENRPFVTFPIILHREIPEDAVLKWAWILRRKVALSYEYHFQITIESDTFAPRLPAIDPRPACAIDIGWRHMKTMGNRVGYFYDSTGAHGEILVPREVHEGLEKANSLRSIQDRHFTETLDKLLAWRETAKLPAWWAEKCKFLGGWRSSARLENVVRYWTKNRIEGDTEIFATMLAWRKQWIHLYQWETHERNNALNRRKNFFRETAKVFAEKYSTIVWEDINLADIGKKKQKVRAKKGTNPDDTTAPAGKRRVQTAPGEFRTILQISAATRTVKVPPAYTTIECSWCGTPNDFDHRILIHTCTNEKCKKTWDQDHNAARNILASASVTKAKSAA